MPTSPAPSDRSRLPLSEVARHVVIPEGIVDTLWFEVEARCRDFGDEFDAWQDGLGQVILGMREDGTWAATIGGVTLSIPRQVAKTFIVGRIIVALCTMFPDLTVLWTAHRGDTATMTFQRLKSVVLRPPVRGYLRAGSNQGTAIRDANGEQQIPFANGSVIMFGAREFGFGRGFDQVDIEVFDEAQILTEKALEDMVAATNQSRFIHGALLFYMGTPPRPGDRGEAFRLRRADALALKRADERHAGDFAGVVEAGDAVYIECSADSNVGQAGGPSLDDRRQVEKANPSFPHRTPLVSVKRLRKNLPGDDSWRREGLGVWDELAGATRLITPTEWTETAIKVAPDGVKSFGVAFSRDGHRLAVGGARRHDGDRVHVELIDGWSGPMDAGVAKVADWLAARWKGTARIVLAGPNAAILLNALRDRRVPARMVHVMTTPEYLTGCAMLLDGIRDRTVTHWDDPGQKVLDDSVEVSDKKARGPNGLWGWDATTPDGDETPVEAISAALWGARTRKRAYSGGAVMA